MTNGSILKRLVLLWIPLAALACGDSTRPGSRSTVTAYEVDGTTVIKLESCPRIGRTYDYVSCGSKLRAEVNAMLCARGSGTHTWMYQIGTSSPIVEHERCR
jgi:hypothetical protein